MNIPYASQDIDQNDIDAVIEVLKSDFITQGPIVKKFELAVSNYASVKYAAATNSATSALHIACLSLDLKPNDYLWTSPNSFVSSANCALFCGAKVDFVDIDPDTYNISIKKLEDKLKAAKLTNKLPKILIPVHFAGQSCDMQKIHELSLKYGFRIIEDASHAIGGSYKGKKVGSCAFSDITVFSFHPVKIITTAEGGMAVTNDKKLYESMQLYRSHGILNDKQSFRKRPDEEIWNYQQVSLGFNYRLSDIHAALGLSQLNRIDEFVERRHEIATLYNNFLSDLNITLPYQSKNNYSSYHLYPIRVKKRIKQKELYKVLHEKKIIANVHYIPIHRQPFYEDQGFKKGNFPEAEALHKEVISLPMFYTLSPKEIEYVSKTLSKILK